MNPKIFVTGTRGFPNIQGGIEKHCEELYTHLVAKGVHVTVCIRAPYVPSSQRIESWKGISFRYVWCPRIKSFEAIIHTFLCILIARFNSADILHVHAVGPSLLVPFARLLGMKVVMTHHGPDYERKKWSAFAKFTLKMGEVAGVFCSNCVIVISNAIEKNLRIKYGNRNLVVIHNGVTLKISFPAGNMLKKLGVQPRRYIFTACRFVPEKGLHDLITAYSQLADKSIALVIAGGEDHPSEYGKSIIDLAARHNVILTGIIFKNDIAELFSNARLFVLPSYYEGFPIALLEALGYSIPVLISDIPAHHEIPLHSNRYIKTGDIDDLTKMMRLQLSQNSSNEELNEYRRIVEELFNWDYIANQTLNVYRKILMHDKH